MRQRLDLRGTLVHELGHVLGFGHPCAVFGERPQSFVTEQGTTLEPCESKKVAESTSVMMPSAELASERLAPSEDDARGLCEVYGNQSRAPRPADSTRGCGCALARAGVPPAIAWPGLACAIAARRRLRRNRRPKLAYKQSQGRY